MRNLRLVLVWHHLHPDLIGTGRVIVMFSANAQSTCIAASSTAGHTNRHDLQCSAKEIDGREDLRM
jgi:hypothetical protein